MPTHEHHEYYERLCAAAVTGHITPGERLELGEHATTCAQCREFIADVAGVVAPGIAAAGGEDTSLPNGATERFLARARSEGIPLKPKRSRPRNRRRRQSGFIAISAVAASVALALLFRAFFVQDVVPILRPTPIKLVFSVPAAPSIGADLSEENAALRKQLESLQSQIVSLHAKLASQGEVLGTLDQLQTTVAAAQTQNKKFEQTLAERDIEMAALRETQARSASVREANDIAIQAEEAELVSLRRKVGTLTAQLQQTEQLSTAARRAKDLIIARNLHIVDVHETDESGESQRSFGRIFYTAGQSLVFYAYDLPDVQGRAEFYVWGAKLSDDRRPNCLGVLRADDLAAGRWILTFDLPRVLSQIDSVFVTAESSKRPPSQPSRKKLLYAYLGNEPNHP